MAPDSGVAPGRHVGALAPHATTHVTLHLGVLVQQYRNDGLTTADVARFLEDKYGVMGAFYRVHQADVIKALEDSLGGAVESLMMGRRVEPWGRAMQAIQREFRNFISSKEAERVGIPGTPTKAALRGVSHRRKHPYSSKNPRRPSFRDTGLYMASFRSWID